MTPPGGGAPVRRSVWKSILATTGRRIMAAVVAVGAVIGVATGALELKAELTDDKPVKGAVDALDDPLLNVPATEFARSHPDWFESGMQPEQLGAVFALDVGAGGLEGKTLALRWEVRDANTHSVVASPPWAPESLELRPTRDGWTDQAKVWVPFPAVERFTVVFTVEYDGDVLRSDTSAPLRVGRF